MTVRDALFRVLVFLAFFGHAAAAMLYAWLNASDSVRGAIYFGSKVVVNAIPLICIFGLERRRFTLKKPTWRGIRDGAIIGVAMGGVILLLYHAVLADRVDVELLRSKLGAYGVVDRFVFFAPFLCLVNSFFEEYYWRWFMYKILRRWMGRTPAVIISSMGFTLHHVVVLSAYFSQGWLIVLLNVGVLFGGIFWAHLYDESDNLYAPWLSHAIADAAIMAGTYDLLF